MTRFYLVKSRSQNAKKHASHKARLLKLRRRRHRRPGHRTPCTHKKNRSRPAGFFTSGGWLFRKGGVRPHTSLDSEPSLPQGTLTSVRSKKLRRRRHRRGGTELCVHTRKTGPAQRVFLLAAAAIMKTGGSVRTRPWTQNHHYPKVL